MKKDKENCKKGKESTIGKIIYGFLMFMPLFAIGTTCLISTFNISAKQESEIIYKYETNEVNSANDLVVGNVYTLHCKNLKSSDMQVYEFFILPINEFTYKYHNIVEAYTDVDYSIYPLSYIYLSQSDIIELTYISDLTGDMYLNLDDVTFTSDIDFIFIEKNIESHVIINNVLLSHISKCENIPIDHVETHNVEAQDVFYNAINKVTTSPLFNWATNSSLYNVINNTCTELSITNTLVPLLLTYWLIISLIYFIYDIILIILNVLHRKIHELQDSI